ncbi:hypothetical protein Q73A0000_16505 [Kaistella flava (ex Peng et al. 2021)]|uniref:Uncharacterized protein n=1 Tax=Kaistella flava (ex Peng et al. 2021) TaxID=2038776 RepID=A0A7M2YCL8_9FLAO|nr:hypothetical protein [Kaistella flava (ex Peng et al. 2021)]QOW11846.1 hypothetical protein Q73A0000_16505 [Kaistella flava (ex Peng et al. 2021)]
MKKFLFVLVLLFAILVSAQNLPSAVSKSFNKQFPNQVITSWNDNGYYNYEDDWGDDVYFGDYDFDGFMDAGFDGYFSPYGFGYGYGNGYGYGYASPYYGLNREYEVPVDYVVRTEVSPTYYQIYFTMDNIKMTSLFKPDGTFIIAKGRVHNLPSSVTSAAMGKFKGQTIRFGLDMEKIIVPSVATPVYRFKVEVRRARSHIVKMDTTGKVISDNIR